MHFSEIVASAHATALEKGWYENGDRNFGEVIALMHSELSEALEAWREGCKFQDIWWKDMKPEGIAIEFADVIIRIADTCAHLNIPIEQALKEKLEYNRKRTYRHGGKKA